MNGPEDWTLRVTEWTHEMSASENHRSRVSGGTRVPHRQEVSDETHRETGEGGTAEGSQNGHREQPRSQGGQSTGHSVICPVCCYTPPQAHTIVCA